MAILFSRQGAKLAKVFQLFFKLPHDLSSRGDSLV